MNEYTEYGAIKEAVEKIQPEREKQEKTTNKIIENIGTIVTVSIIALSMILFAFDKGFCGVYKIPNSFISLDITRFLPITVQMMGILAFIFMYISSVKTDIVQERIKFRVFRVFILEFALLLLLFQNNMFFVLPWWILLWLVLGPLLIELGLVEYCKTKTKKSEDIELDKKTYENETRRIILHSIFPQYSMKMLLFISAFVVIISPFFGMAKAFFTRDYQVFVDNNQQYAVIVDNSDIVLAQKVDVDNGTLVIDISDYYYFAKDSRKFVYSRYDNVKLDNKSNKNINLLYATPDQATISEPVTT